MDHLHDIHHISGLDEQTWGWLIFRLHQWSHTTFALRSGCNELCQATHIIISNSPLIFREVCAPAIPLELAVQPFAQSSDMTMLKLKSRTFFFPLSAFQTLEAHLRAVHTPDSSSLNRINYREPTQQSLNTAVSVNRVRLSNRWPSFAQNANCLCITCIIMSWKYIKKFFVKSFSQSHW